MAYLSNTELSMVTQHTDVKHKAPTEPGYARALSSVHRHQQKIEKDLRKWQTNKSDGKEEHKEQKWWEVLTSYT